jgi:outer membrane protein assembly factor BamB
LRDGKHKKASPANSSPVTDGKHVYFYFKSGDLACLNMDGTIAWEKNLQAEYGEDTLWWDLGTSPVLLDNKLIVACVQTGPSWVAAFDKTTGKEVWKQKREMNAPVEANQSYSTPMVIQRDGKKELVVLGADYVTSHDPQSGKELWRVGDLNPKQEKYFRSIASPVFNSKRVFAPYARGDSLTAIDLGGKGDITESHVPWTIDFSADVPTPAITGQRMYVLRDKNEIVCVSTESGETIWKGKLEKHRSAFSASPVVADGKVFVTREDGKTFVVADSDKFELIASNELNEQTVATPVLLDGRIYLRTYEHLYCIGK